MGEKFADLLNRLKFEKKGVIKLNELSTKKKTFYNNRSQISFTRYTLTQRSRKIKFILNYYLKTINHEKINYLLDIGCADGLMTKNISKKFPEFIVIGIEKNINFMPCSKKTLFFIYGDGCNLPFKKGKFDTIILSSIFKHISKPKKLIQEIKMAIKKDGILIICDPTPFITKIGILTKKFNRKYLFNILSLNQYKLIFESYGFRTLLLQKYMPPILLPAYIEKIFSKKKFFQYISLHQVAVFKS